MTLQKNKKKQVTNKSLLDNSSTLLVQLTTEAIDDIGEVTIHSKKKITYAKNLYLGLSAMERISVRNASKITDAESKYIEKFISPAIELIKELDDITLASEPAIIKAEKACSQLDEEDLKKVYNYPVLLSSRQLFDTLKRISEN